MERGEHGEELRYEYADDDKIHFEDNSFENSKGLCCVHGTVEEGSHGDVWENKNDRVWYILLASTLYHP